MSSQKRSGMNGDAMTLPGIDTLTEGLTREAPMAGVPMSASASQGLSAGWSAASSQAVYAVPYLLSRSTTPSPRSSAGVLLVPAAAQVATMLTASLWWPNR